MYTRMRPLLYRLPPERAHALALRSLAAAAASPAGRAALRATFMPRAATPVDVFGLHFANPVGLAAGFDKDGIAWRGAACLGFGHLEIGTVTPVAQAGNPRPRVFRLVEDEALVNRLGFPGRGAQAAAHALRGAREIGVVIGVNIGRNAGTNNENASNDYLACVDALAGHADYFAVNVSSPNTTGLRALQGRSALEGLLIAIARRRDDHVARLGRQLPLLVKLAPDLDDAGLDAALEAVDAAGIDGVIATNTTLAREGLRSVHAAEAGGLSGAPLRRRSVEVVREIVRRTAGRLPVVGVGGVAAVDDAAAMLDAGARLVQLYTGLVYEGPGVVRRLVEGLAARRPA